jgi:hypothetical protein
MVPPPFRQDWRAASSATLSLGFAAGQLLVHALWHAAQAASLQLGKDELPQSLHVGCPTWLQPLNVPATIVAGSHEQNALRLLDVQVVWHAAQAASLQLGKDELPQSEHMG